MVDIVTLLILRHEMNVAVIKAKAWELGRRKTSKSKQ